MNCSELKMLISVCGDCMLNMYEGWRGQDVIYIHTCIRVKIKAWPWCINPSTNVQLSLARFRIKPCFCQQHRAWILHPAPTRRPACFNAQPVDSGCVSPVRLYDHTTLWLLESALTRTASRRRRTFKKKKRKRSETPWTRRRLEEVALQLNLINVMLFIRKKTERNCVVSITDGKLFEIYFCLVLFVCCY